MATSDPFDLDGETQTKEARDELAKLKRQIEIEDFKWLMSNKRGRRIVWRLLEECRINAFEYIADQYLANFVKGRQDIGARILLDCHQHTPERYFEMLKEAQDATRSSSNAATGGNNAAGSDAAARSLN